MSVFATLGSVGASLAALGYLAATDPKRRRAFRLEPARRRNGRCAWAIALLPGLALPVVGGAGGFFVWFGAISVAGWALAATSPERIAAGQRVLQRAADSARTRVAPLAVWVADRRRRAAAVASMVSGKRVAELERRVQQLETDLAQIRQGAIRTRPDGDRVVVELAIPAGRR